MCPGVARIRWKQRNEGTLLLQPWGYDSLCSCHRSEGCSSSLGLDNDGVVNLVTIHVWVACRRTPHTNCGTGSLYVGGAWSSNTAYIPTSNGASLTPNRKFCCTSPFQTAKPTTPRCFSLCTHWGNVRVILGVIFWDNGNKMEATVLYSAYLHPQETTTLCRVYVGIVCILYIYIYIL